MKDHGAAWLTMALLVMGAFLLAKPNPPSHGEMEGALAAAKTAWLVERPVTLRLSPLNDCNTRHGAHPQIAQTETSTTVFQTEDGEATGRADEVAWTITLNSNCDWHEQSLGVVMLHEYGHVLGVPHSDNPRSVMFWITQPGGWQEIMKEDREKVKR